MQITAPPRLVDLPSGSDAFEEQAVESIQTYRPSVLIAGDGAAVADRLKAFLRLCKFNVEVHSNLGSASQIAKPRKLDGVFLFWKASESQTLVNDLRASGLNRSSIICALTAERAPRNGTFKPGCNFTVDIPSFANHLQRYLKVMFGLVTKEHRRYFRSRASCGVALPSSPMVAVECLDISTTGIGLQLTPLTLTRGERVTLAMDFFDRRPAVRIESEVRWIEAGGRAGLSFLQMPVETLERLQAWIENSIGAAEKTLSGNKGDFRN